MAGNLADDGDLVGHVRQAAFGNHLAGVQIDREDLLGGTPSSQPNTTTSSFSEPSALAQQASVLLLDEPEAGLDHESRAAIHYVLAEEVARGACVVVATHDIGTATAAQRCVLLRGGHVVADGRPEEILTGDNYAEAFLSDASAR